MIKIEPNIRVGKLIVLKEDVLTNRGLKWLCQCDCGNTTSVREDNLIEGYYNIKGGTRSCGCLNPVKNHCNGLQIIDRTGEIVNNYKYILRLLPDSNRSYKWLLQDLLNGYYRVSCPRNIKGLSHNVRYEFKTAKEALDDYYKKLSSKQFSKFKDENNIMTMLFENHFIWSKHFSFEDCKDKVPLPFDIAIFNEKSFNLEYLIEYDGGQHFKKVSCWDFNTIKEHDLMKNKYCFEHSIPLIRIPYDAKYTIDDLKLETTRFLLTPDNEEEYYVRTV